MLICEGVMFIAGLIALIAGKIRLYGQKTVEGTRARVIGLILLLPGPLALGIGLMFGLSGATQDTIEALSICELGMLVIAIIAALVIALTAPQTPAPTMAAAPAFSGYPATPDIMNVSEAAQYMRISVTEVLQLIESKQLRAQRVGDQYRISKEAIRTFLNS